MVGGARLSTSLSSTSLLSNCLVGYHFCQSDNSPTCHVPEFVHSLAAQLSQCPQLSSYHHILQSDINILNHLSWTACNINPHQSLNKGILEPLTELERSGKISVGMSIIAIDGLCEAEHHRPDYGDTMATFLAKHIGNFPPWLKIVATVRTSLGETLHNLPFHQIRYVICSEQTILKVIFAWLVAFKTLQLQIVMKILQSVQTGKKLCINKQIFAQNFLNAFLELLFKPAELLVLKYFIGLYILATWLHVLYYQDGIFRHALDEIYWNIICLMFSL